MWGNIKTHRLLTYRQLRLSSARLRSSCLIPCLLAPGGRRLLKEFPGGGIDGRQSNGRVILIREGAVKSALDDVWRSWEKVQKRRDRDAHVDLPIMSSKVVEVSALADLDDLVAGGVKTKSPIILVFLYLDGMEDVLPLCPEPDSGDVVMPEHNLPDHVVGPGGTNFSVVSNYGDGLKRVEWEVLIVPNADVGDSRVLIDGIVFFAINSNEIVLDEEFDLLKQRRGDGAGRVYPWSLEQ
ncbi:hypothetical protein CRG98_038463 [Punica granatum]|uniref:Uncharacterized protein n=1 Tax=Punica granatum TaxID=22663 RepID=A0A2I0ICM3_PUNGR|nr:hypothetical protein CRG98_038463 [Punica granatum]